MSAGGVWWSLVERVVCFGGGFDGLEPAFELIEAGEDVIELLENLDDLTRELIGVVLGEALAVLDACDSGFDVVVRHRWPPRPGVAVDGTLAFMERFSFSCACPCLGMAAVMLLAGEVLAEGGPPVFADGVLDPYSGFVFHTVDRGGAARGLSVAAEAIASERFDAELVPISMTDLGGDPQSEAARGDGHPVMEAAEGPIPFGMRGHQAISFGLGVGIAPDSTDYQGYASYHHFLADRLEFSLQAGGWFFDQDEDGQDGEPADETGGASLSFAVRLYFLDTDMPTADQWAWYGEAGVGILGSVDDVPGGGTSFNFLPRAGGGVLIPLTDSGTRLDVGVRWHHVSNASIFGTDDNPDRDGVMIYAGVMFPLH